MTADTTPEQDAPDAPEQVEPKLTKAQQAEQDKRATANVPDELHDIAKAEGWSEGQQGPFGR